MLKPVKILLIILLFGIAVNSIASAADNNVLADPAPQAADRIPQPKPNVGTTTKIIPLPIYATLPNEGNTFGFMPVFLVVEQPAQRTQSIFAPSVSWNKIIRYTTTFRWYYFPDRTSALTFIPSISSNVNRGVTLEYAKLPRIANALTYDLGMHFRRSLFYRFFGIGPETRSGNESSYTRLGGDFAFRQGYNVTRYLNLGARVSFLRDLAERKHVSFLPLAHDRFPGTPGLGGSTILGQSLSLRYDTRGELRENATRGFYSELSTGIFEGLSGTDTFNRTTFEARGLWEETSFLNGGARLFWGYSGGHDIPFFYQSSLGGSFLLRGFTEDRFIDKGAWELELEQRLTVLKTHIYGVTADWRIDPFIAMGQVYHDARDLVRHTKVTGGLGFRAFVRPNVLGRVDTAIGGEGIKVYVELGYPF